MCWVMPPASPAATPVWRIASRSEVLPWSDVAHDGHDGGAAHQVLGVVVEGVGVLLLGRHDLHAPPQVVGDELNEVVAHGLGQGQRRAEQKQALDDVVCGDVEGLGELGDRGALAYLDDVEVVRVLVVGQGLLDGGLVALLLGGSLAALLALLAAARLAGGLGDGLAGLGEDAVAAVLLRLARHACVVVLGRLLLLLGRLALGLVALLLGARLLGRGLRAARRRGDARPGACAGVGPAAFGAIAARRVAQASLALLGGLLLLLLGGEHALLLGYLLEQRGERGRALGGRCLRACGAPPRPCAWLPPRRGDAPPLRGGPPRRHDARPSTRRSSSRRASASWRAFSSSARRACSSARRACSSARRASSILAARCSRIGARFLRTRLT